MVKCIFINGPISEDILEEFRTHLNESIGATAIFEGIIRADSIGNKKVASIDFTSQKEIAHSIALEILNIAKQKYSLSCATIYHSIAKIKVGENCFRVEVSAPHRKAVFLALPEIVDEFKAKVPVFGKEIFEDNTYSWKQNKE